MLVQNQFDVEFQKTAITGCDIEVYLGVLGVLVLDKTFITSLTTKRVNRGVWDSIPFEETTIEVVGWKRLTQAQKNLFEIGTVVSFSYVVNGYKTTKLFQVLEEVAIDTNDENKATIKCAGAFRHSSQIRQINNFQRIVSYGYETYPMNISCAEENQHLALTNGYGLRATGIGVLGLTTEQLNLGNCETIYSFNKKNIIGKIKQYPDTPNKAKIEACGVDVDAVEKVVAKKETLNDGNSYFVPFEEQSYVTSIVAEAYINGSWRTLTSTECSRFTCAGGVEFNYLGSQTPTSFRFTVNGKRVINVPTTNSEKTLCSRLLLNTNTSRLETARNKARQYYAYDTYVEFDCRLDPRFEPQDCMFVDGIGILRIEETTLNFGGGFKGHIKARLVQKAYSSVKSPVVGATTYGNDSYSIPITNPNPFTLTLNIVYSSGIIAREFAPNETFTFNQNSYPALVDSANAHGMGDLREEVYCWFASDSDYYYDSDNSIIWEAD